MLSVMLDVFDRFAAQCQLELHAEPLVAAPRDVLAGLEETDQYYLVTLSSRASSESARVIFIRPTTDPSPPTMRDVLWWLAADSWAVDQADRDISRWAATYGIPVGAEPTARLFRLHVAQRQGLARLLGDDAYLRLLALYDAEVTRTK